jgi:hypothetical protein
LNILLCVSLVGIVSLAIDARQVWVSPTGVSGADGSFSKPFAGIKTGVTNAVNGDTVIMKAGNYYAVGGVSFGNKKLTVTSQIILDGDTNWVNSTVVRCTTTTVFWADSEPSTEMNLMGFSVRKGIGRNVGGRGLGGGIYIRGCEAPARTRVSLWRINIDSCSVRMYSQSMTPDGGGLYATSTELYLTKCNIRNNTVFTYGTGGG